MSQILVDLHVHTTASDGTYSPEEILSMAKNLNIEFLAITDHDTISGIKSVANFKDEKLKVITGVEISADFPGILHILGYGIDISNKVLNNTLKFLQNYRKERNEKIIKKMREEGFDITLEELKELAKDDLIGRPHFAQLMVKKGYVKDIREAFDKYLKEGAKFYIEKKRLSPKEAIHLITQANGIPVIAHPYQTGLDNEKLERLIEELVSYGLKGIEVFYPHHDNSMIEFYLYLAKKYDLLVTAGSDFHGLNTPDISLGMKMEYNQIRRFLRSVGYE